MCSFAADFRDDCDAATALLSLSQTPIE